MKLLPDTHIYHKRLNKNVDHIPDSQMHFMKEAIYLFLDIESGDCE